MCSRRRTPFFPPVRLGAWRYVCVCWTRLPRSEVEPGDEQGGFGRLSKTSEVQDQRDQGRAKNVELEGLSVTIRGWAEGEKKTGGSRTHVSLVVAM